MTARNYRFLWLALFAVASTYLTGLYLFAIPEQSAGERPVMVQSRHGPADAGDTLLTGSLPVQPALGLGALDAEIRWLKSAVNDLRKRDESLQERVGLIEKAFGPATSALPRQEGQPRPPADSYSALNGAAPDPVVTVETQPLPNTGFGDDMLGRSPLPVASPGKPSRTLFAVELATAADRKTAAKQWSELKERHGALLVNLQAKVGIPQETGVNARKALRLIAGPFSNAADAASACVRLRAAGATCAETIFTGEDF